MELLQHLLRDDPAAPRLSMYDEAAGTRMDFSAQTLDNWASKIANMLLEELELDSTATIRIDLPVSWQAAVIAFGALTAGVPFTFAGTRGDAVFTSPESFATAQGEFPGADIVLVTQDPFGRGVVECGGELPLGAIDFGPTVRFYGDQFFGPAPALGSVVPTATEPQRLLSHGWSDNASFSAAVLEPLAAGGSAVVVAGLVSAERLEEIAGNEKVTARLG